MEELKDYYYSAKQEQIIKGFSEIDNEEYIPNNIKINGQQFIYTECMKKGTKNTSSFNDIIFLGTAKEWEDYHRGCITESIRKYI